MEFRIFSLLIQLLCVTTFQIQHVLLKRSAFSTTEFMKSKGMPQFGKNSLLVKGTNHHTILDAFI
jgi:hypothetical protein